MASSTYCGVEERLITGKETSDYEKISCTGGHGAKTLGNPLYHWTHLELRRPFGITNTLLDPQSADAIWEHCNAKLATQSFRPAGSCDR
ncbi:Uronate isomerase [Citrobacter werkmanii]|nr:Uronate isomerase [Citrobacter werkmanii]